MVRVGEVAEDIRLAAGRLTTKMKFKFLLLAIFLVGALLAINLAIMAYMIVSSDNGSGQSGIKMITGDSSSTEVIALGNRNIADSESSDNGVITRSSSRSSDSINQNSNANSGNTNSGNINQDNGGNINPNSGDTDNNPMPRPNNFEEVEA